MLDECLGECAAMRGPNYRRGYSGRDYHVTGGHEAEAEAAQKAKKPSRLGVFVLRVLGYRGGVPRRPSKGPDRLVMRESCADRQGLTASPSLLARDTRWCAARKTRRADGRLTVGRRLVH